MKMFYLFMILISALVVFLIGCATKSNLCPAPEGEISAICQIAQKMNTSPEAISQILLISNMAALDEELYTAQEAKTFVETILKDIDKIQADGTSITYLQAIDYVNKKFKLLSPKAQACFVILNPVDLAEKEIKIPLSEYDLGLVKRHLKKQLQIINVYL
jgi:hypothetical protein